MANSRLQLATFYIFLALTTIAVVFMWWPFLRVLVFAVILTILFSPVHQGLLRRVKNPTAAALLTILIILLIVVLPLLLIGEVVLNEVITVYHNLSQQGFSVVSDNFIQHLPPNLQGFMSSLGQGLSGKIAGITGDAFNSLTNVISNVFGFLVSFFLTFISVYYLLKDGKKFKAFLNSILPLSKEHESVLVERMERAITGVIKGSFLTSLCQGIASVIGFSLFGLPQPFLWAIFVVMAALIPTIGTTFSLGTAVLYLLFTNHIGAAVGLAIWSTLSIGFIDNILSPKFISSRTELHPLLILVGVLGGIELFGILGFLLGPIITAVFMALLNIYRSELRSVQ